MLEFGTEGADVAEQPARLILGRLEAGEVLEPLAVIAVLDDTRDVPHLSVGRISDDVHLLDVEAQVVQPLQALIDPEGLVARRSRQEP